MRRIPAGQARAGDVLAEPLLDGQGRKVLPRGARLSAAVLSRFERWQVAEVVVEGEDETPETEAPDDAPGAGATANTALLEALAHRFEGHEDDPAMARIQAVARRHLASLPPQA